MYKIYNKKKIKIILKFDVKFTMLHYRNNYPNNC